MRMRVTWTSDWMIKSTTIAALVACVVPTQAGAQAKDLLLITGNGLLAGITAGVAQSLRGGSFVDGFKEGAMGGSVHYAGKRIMSVDVAGALFVGRQLSALGASMALNATRGSGRWDRVLLPFGPVALELRRREDGLAVSPSVSIYDLVKVAEGIANRDRRLDWGETLSTGTVVFGSRENELFAAGLNGATDGSVVHLDDGLAPGERRQVLVHEMVHVAQRDFMNRALFVPLEDRLVSRFTEKPRAIRLELLYPGVRKGLAAIGVFETEVPPLETEAEWIERRF